MQEEPAMSSSSAEFKRIEKISDIEGSKKPNLYDEESSHSGLSANYARRVLENGEDKFDGFKEYWAPIDGADLSRVIVAIENFLQSQKKSGKSIEDLLDPLWQKSADWSGIVDNYAELKELVLQGTSMEIVNRVLTARMNEVKRRDAHKYLSEAEKELKHQLASLHFFDMKQSGCSIRVSNVNLANAIILKAAERQFHITTNQREGMETAHGTMHRDVISVIYDPRRESPYPSLLDPKRHNGSTIVLRISPQSFHCEPIPKWALNPEGELLTTLTKFNIQKLKAILTKSLPGAPGGPRAFEEKYTLLSNAKIADIVSDIFADTQMVSVTVNENVITFEGSKLEAEAIFLKAANKFQDVCTSESILEHISKKEGFRCLVNIDIGNLASHFKPKPNFEPKVGL